MNAFHHQLVVPENFKLSGVAAFFTNRHTQNQIKPLIKQMGYGHVNLFMPMQRHTATAYLLEKNFHYGSEVVADAVITMGKNIFIGVAVADCVPILLYDTQTKAIGAVHAGWRGTADGILLNTLTMMKRHFNTNPDHVHMAIGPCIHRCCYQVGSEIAENVASTTGQGAYIEERKDGLYLDLKEANRLQAESFGLKNIWVSDKCTFCSSTELFSYRREGKNAGRQGGFIGIIDGTL
jgi:YfiH family protein